MAANWAPLENGRSSTVRTLANCGNPYSQVVTHQNALAAHFAEYSQGFAKGTFSGSNTSMFIGLVFPQALLVDYFKEEGRDLRCFVIRTSRSKVVAMHHNHI